MNEWNVFLTIAAIVSFLLAIGGPVVYTVKTLAKVTTTLDRLQKDMEDEKKQSIDAYRKLWEHNDKQDAEIAKHDREIYGIKLLLEADPN